MTPPRAFLPTLNAILRHLPKQAGFLSVGVPGAAFEKTVLALRPDLAHVSALSTELLVALPEFAASLLGRPIPRTVLGAQAGEAVIGPVVRLGDGVLRAGALRAVVQPVSGLLSDMRRLALIHIDGAADQTGFLTAAMAALVHSEALLWIDLPAHAGSAGGMDIGQVPGLASYAVFGLTGQGALQEIPPPYGALDGIEALILVPGGFWDHEQFSAAHGRLIPKTRDTGSHVSALLADLPVEERIPALPPRYDCRLGESAFSNLDVFPPGAASPDHRVFLRRGQVFRLLLPAPPMDGFFVALRSIEAEGPEQGFHLCLRSSSSVLRMPWDEARSAYTTRTPASLPGREACVIVEATCSDRPGPLLRALTLGGLEITAIYCDADADAAPLEDL